jgi:malonyl-CoA decarboxylase
LTHSRLSTIEVPVHLKSPGVMVPVQASAEPQPSDPDAALLPELERDGWWHDLAQSERLRPALMRLCALYLTEQRSPGSRIDPVARFHLGNGARLERINWLGNATPRAIQESFGIMVNYLYDHDSIEDNHEAFVRDGTVVRSPDVDALLEA